MLYETVYITEASAATVQKYVRPFPKSVSVETESVMNGTKKMERKYGI